MPNQIGGQNPTGNPDSNPPPPPPIKPTIEQRVMALESKSCTNAKQENSDNLASAVKMGEAWLIGINGALLITTIVIACIYYGQLKQMTTATTATQNAVCVASQTFLESRRSNTLQETLNEKSINATVDSFHLDQRAWIGIGDAVITLNVTDPEKVTLTIKNVGKTPATEIVSQIGISEQPRGHELKLADLKYLGDPSRSGTLFPGASTWIGKNLEAVAPGQTDEINVLKSGDRFAYVFAIVNYNDVFNKPHWTHSCGVIQKDLVSIHACKIYNDTDPSIKSKETTDEGQTPTLVVPEVAQPCKLSP
jgi:hypothetical protein